MKNDQVGLREADDIRRQVTKVLRGLGNPSPPLDLTQVRELLRLDREYYSTSDSSLLREMVSRVKVGIKQLALRPSLLIDVIKKADLHALYVPDKKRILISKDLPAAKHRWAEAHEIGHDLAEWHREFLFGDDETTLSTNCRETLESEANYGAGQLLFLQDRFVQEASDSAPSLKHVLQMAKSFGNSNTSTLWRFVEESNPGVPMVGLVFANPFRQESDFNHANPRVYCIESPEFRKRFAVAERKLLDHILGYIKARRGGPLGSAERSLHDVNGDAHPFRFESWSNTYEILSLGVWAGAVKSFAS